MTKRLSLYGLKLNDVLKAALNTPPPPKEKKVPKAPEKKAVKSGRKR